MKNIILLVCLAVTFLPSCSSNQVAAISKLKEMQKGEDKKCDYIKKIEIESNHGDEREALNIFKGKVVDSGANAYMIDETVNNGNITKIRGNSFFCNNK